MITGTLAGTASPGPTYTAPGQSSPMDENITAGRLKSAAVVRRVVVGDGKVADIEPASRPHGKKFIVLLSAAGVDEETQQNRVGIARVWWRSCYLRTAKQGALSVVRIESRGGANIPVYTVSNLKIVAIGVECVRIAGTKGTGVQAGLTVG